jgi:DNA-binding beta-propeller fold protein YncE
MPHREMSADPRPGSLLRWAACAAILLAAAPLAAQAPPDHPPEYEIWAIDQGTHVVHIFDEALKETDRIDLGAHGVRVPHMIEFTPDQRYGFVASPGSGDVTVIRALDRQVVAVLPTGPRTHHAAVAPDGRAVLVSVIGAADTPWDGRLVEITVDPDARRFEIGRQLVLAEDSLFAARADEFRDTSGAVCLAFTADGRHGYVTLGPDLDEGGVVVLDIDTFRLIEVFAPGEVQANCGTILSPDGERMYLVGGDGETGVWHAVDTRTRRPVHHGDSHGHDAHGSAFTPDGREYWLVNRVTSNAVVIDPATMEVIAEIPFVGRTPDIIAFSPEGRHAFITLRGPNPVTMPHVAVGETPGFAVIDVSTRELVQLVEPARGDPRSDFHAIAVRQLEHW